jgi:hypothetical protein
VETACERKALNAVKKNVHLIRICWQSQYSPASADRAERKRPALAPTLRDHEAVLLWQQVAHDWKPQGASTPFS